jgi:hypothetical protein
MRADYQQMSALCQWKKGKNHGESAFFFGAAGAWHGPAGCRGPERAIEKYFSAAPAWYGRVGCRPNLTKNNPNNTSCAINKPIWLGVQRVDAEHRSRVS